MTRTPLFVFDMDDVLFDYDWRVRMAGLSAMTGLEFAELRRRWWHDEGEWAAEAGRFADAEAYHAAFTRALGTDIPVEAWIANRRSAMTPWPDSLDAVRRAGELGAVALLTNNGPLVERNLTTLAPELVPLFGDELHTSSFFGARKPDPRVFSNLLAHYEVPAELVFFADDLEVNVEGARSVGIHAHRFVDAAALLAAIEAFAAVAAPA
ncbi:HAD family hydrolase [Lysinimonas soli]|uniref:HAD family hydrolase n=1 Tax=Lysinimonas soli TaxID=1074233 RepID=A0ABW0NMJ3_9MICO